MPASDNSIGRDFLTLVTLWNLYGLPLVLAVVAIGVMIRRRLTSSAAAGLDGLRTVRLIGLIHYALALRSLVQLMQELLTLRAMGIPESIATLTTCALSVLVNPLLGLALRHRPPRARRWAISWYAFLSLIAVRVTFWLWRYHVEVDPARWPDHLVGYGLPLFLLGVMLLPRIKRVFAPESAPRREMGSEPGDRERVPAPAQTWSTSTPARWTIVSLLCLSLLIVAGSTLVVDVADWASRLVFESE
jgi:hypothetical protein